MSITQQVMYLSQLYKPAVAKVEKPRAIGLEPVLVPPYGFFDGAATKGIGGVGFCLYLKVSHSFEFAMGAGTCTNTKAELIALWALFHVSMSMGIPNWIFFVTLKSSSMQLFDDLELTPFDSSSAAVVFSECYG